MLLDGNNQACLRDDVDDGGYVVQDLLDFRRNILKINLATLKIMGRIFYFSEYIYSDSLQFFRSFD